MYREGGQIERTKLHDYDENDEFVQFLDSATPVKDYLQHMRNKRKDKIGDGDDETWFKDEEHKGKM